MTGMSQGVFKFSRILDTFVSSQFLFEQLVGYGTHPFDGDFWIVRNSWSEDWGDKGYIKLKREKGLECGCYMIPENEEDECFTICGMCGIVWWNTFPIGANLVQNT